MLLFIYVSVCVYVYVYAQARGISDHPELELVTGGCKQPDVDAGNSTQVPWKNSKCF